MPMDRPWYDAWVDDDGSNTIGTIWNKAEIKKLVDGLDPSLHGIATYAPVDVAIGSGWLSPNLYGVEYQQNCVLNSPGSVQVGTGGGGLYLVTFSLTWNPATAIGLRGAQLQSTGGIVRLVEYTTQQNNAWACISGMAWIALAAGNSVTLSCYQDVASTITANSRFGMARV